VKAFKYEDKAVKVLDQFKCDKCGKDISDFLSSQEALSWTNPCGFGSVFGDGTYISIDLCQECIKEVLGKYIQYNGD
jgi:hypothetical protein